jgi:hypothetical protein
MLACHLAMPTDESDDLPPLPGRLRDRSPGPQPGSCRPRQASRSQRPSERPGRPPTSQRCMTLALTQVSTLAVPRVPAERQIADSERLG